MDQNIDTRIDFAAVLADLPADDKKVIALFMLGYTQAGIAEESGIAKSTAHRRLRKILEALKDSDLKMYV